jgi:UDP-N-acetylmuramate--alanine ligase
MAAEADYRLELLDAGSALGRWTGTGAGQGSGFSRFQVHTAAGPLGPFELHVPGRHNVLNATAAVAIGRQLGMPPGKIAEGLANFRGVDRRFQQRGTACGITVVDDYGHHPTEIRATLAAARECASGRIHVVFQPHRYSRTLDLLDQFSGAFGDADTVIVLPIYAASEEPIPGVTAERLAERIKTEKGRPRVEFAPDFAAAVCAAAAAAHAGDLILTLGAGSVSQLAPQILAALEALPSG